MSTIRVISAADVEQLFTLPMALEAVEKAYLQKHSGQGAVWPMVFHEFDPGHADLDIKSGHLSTEGIFGLKLVSWFDTNPDQGLPGLFGTSIICDIKTGRPQALLNAGPITALRTGAAGALGAKYLARPDSRHLVMVGCGHLSPYLIAATLLALPGLTTVTLVNPHHPEKAAAALPGLQKKVAALLADADVTSAAAIQASEDVPAAIRAADVILTATPAHAPLIDSAWITPGTHISCVGADMSGKQELDEQIFANARVFGDDRGQCLTAGECEQAAKAGLISDLTAEIGAVIAGQTPGRLTPDDVTIFDSTGIALQDLASAAVILKQARQLGVGEIATL